MALIKCPECGKEVSEHAQLCSNCGYNIRDYMANKKYHEKHEKKNDIDPIEDESYARTGHTGRRNLKCPNCGSKKIVVKNDVPMLLKIMELISVGTVTPMTKAKYRPGMAYTCKECGSNWKESATTNSEMQSVVKNKNSCVRLLIISMIFSFLIGGITLAAILSSIDGINGNLLQFALAMLLLVGATASFLGIFNIRYVIVSCFIYGIAVLIAIVICIQGGALSVIMFALIPFALSDLAYSRCRSNICN